MRVAGRLVYLHSLNVDAAAVVAKLSDLFRSGVRDWSAMRALYHPDALLRTVTGGPKPLSADELLIELEHASRSTWYSVSSEPAVALDEHAVMMRGRMRRDLPDAGFEDAGHVWLLTVRDELIFRQGVYRSTEEAAAAYCQYGVSLGMGEEESPGTVTGRVQKSPLKQMRPAPGEG
jgi:hypothetical protein